VTYANQTFVAVTGKGRVLTSPDGISWSVQTLAPNVWLVGVTYAAGLWVVVGDLGSIYYSADLKNWSAAKAVTTTRFDAVGYTGKTFIAVGEQGLIATSSDAQNWTLRTSGTVNFLKGMAILPKFASLSDQVGTNYTVVSGDLGTLLESVDEGVTWSKISSSNSAAIEALAWRLTPDPLNSSNPFLTVVGTGSNGVTQTVAKPNSAVNNTFGGFGQSTSLSVKGDFRALALGSGIFVTAGDQGAIYTSADGSTWTQRFSGDSPGNLSSSIFLSIAYAETLQRFVLVGTGGTVLISNAAPSYLINVATRGAVTTADPLIGGFVVTGTAQKQVLIRATGPTLSVFGVAKPLSDPVLTVYDAKGNVVAKNAGWSTNANLTALVASAAAQGAFALPANSNDSALLLTLAPGAYTAIITSASGGTGTALFEAYSP